MVNLHAAEVMVNPYPTYSMIREKYPVYQVEPGNVWALSRYEDVQYALKNYKVFISTKKSEIMSPPWIKKECHRDFFLWSKDPPEHSLYRATISHPFATSTINDLLPLIETTAKELIDGMLRKENVEFIEDFAYPYVGTVIGGITGLEGDRCLDDIRGWTNSIQLLVQQKPDKDTIQKIESATIEQNNNFIEIIERKRKKPGTDIVSSMVRADINGVPLSNEVMINALNLVISAGFVTTVHQLGNTLVQLARRPGLLKLLINSPDLIPIFIDEVLRLYSSVPTVHRHTAEDITLHNVTIPKGSQIALLLVAANRDPRKFPNPDIIDLYRKRKQHMAFGYGPHVCVGLALARVELEIALRYLLSRIDHISCPPEHELKWIPSYSVRGLEELPVSFQ